MMDSKLKATRIDLFSFRTIPMRTFHMTWLAFFLCFIAWFGMAPLMSVVREEFALTKGQIGNIIMASVAATVIARLFAGWCCDRFGPRRTYTWLLAIGALPVMLVGLSNSYETFLMFRLGISVIGASFVVTQFHTTMMFAPNCVGTANATAAGWGNLGGGVTQLVMPLLFAAFVALGLSNAESWRAAMVMAGLLCLGTAWAYYHFTRDTPEGDFKDLRAQGRMSKPEAQKGAFMEAAKDPRVWALFVVYGACFGVEITIDNVAALYFTDYFGLGVTSAGAVAASFGMLNLFARALGGIYGDKFGRRYGLKGRVRWLFVVLLAEAIALLVFSQMTMLPLAVITMMIFGLFVCMGCGAVYAITPFINKRAIGPVAGIIGAGGNVGALLSSYLFKMESIDWPQALTVLGFVVLGCAVCTLLVRFQPEDEEAARKDMEERLAAANMLPEPATA